MRTTAAGLAEGANSASDGGRRTIVPTNAALGARPRPTSGYWLGFPAEQSKAAVGMLVDGGAWEEVATEDGAMLMVAGSRLEAVDDGVRLVDRFEPVLLAHKDQS